MEMKSSNNDKHEIWTREFNVVGGRGGVPWIVVQKQPCESHVYF